MIYLYATSCSLTQRTSALGSAQQLARLWRLLEITRLHRGPTEEEESRYRGQAYTQRSVTRASRVLLPRIICGDASIGVIRRRARSRAIQGGLSMLKGKLTIRTSSKAVRPSRRQLKLRLAPHRGETNRSRACWLRATSERGRGSISSPLLLVLPLRARARARLLSFPLPRKHFLLLFHRHHHLLLLLRPPNRLFSRLRSLFAAISFLFGRPPPPPILMPAG